MNKLATGQSSVLIPRPSKAVQWQLLEVTMMAAEARLCASSNVVMLVETMRLRQQRRRRRQRCWWGWLTTTGGPYFFWYKTRTKIRRSKLRSHRQRWWWCHHRRQLNGAWESWTLNQTRLECCTRTNWIVGSRILCMTVGFRTLDKTLTTVIFVSVRKA